MKRPRQINSCARQRPLRPPKFHRIGRPARGRWMALDGYLFSVALMCKTHIYCSRPRHLAAGRPRCPGDFGHFQPPDWSPSCRPWNLNVNGKTMRRRQRSRHAAAVGTARACISLTGDSPGMAAASGSAAPAPCSSTSSAGEVVRHGRHVGGRQAHHHDRRAVGRSRSHPARNQAWIAHQVPQCGWCQSGMLMRWPRRHEGRAPRQRDPPRLSNLCVCGT